MRPPCSPAPGPMSTIQSAARIVSSSCSTTINVLPRSRSERNPFLERGQKLARSEHRIVHDFADAAAGDRHRQRLRLQASPLAGGARPRRHVALQLVANELAVCLFEAPFEVRDDALVA